MKSIIISLLFLTFGTVPSGAAVFEPVLEEETIVDDIPFDTQWILIHEGMLPAFELEEEEYIDDIPFNTEEITRSVLLSRMEQDYSDEAYVDDIPFSTEAIASAGFTLETGELICKGHDVPCSKRRSLTRDKNPQYIELEAQGYDITRYLDKVMETIERLHIQSALDYEKKIFYLNHSFDAL